VKELAESKGQLPPMTEKKIVVSNMIPTVKENRKGYMQCQFERAKAARRLQHVAGTPTVKNFKHML